MIAEGRILIGCIQSMLMRAGTVLVERILEHILGKSKTLLQ